jgi:hypothetical protein
MLWVCKACTTQYAVGLDRCPQCGSTEYIPDHLVEADMPKISKEQGPSYAPDLVERTEEADPTFTFPGAETAGAASETATAEEDATTTVAEEEYDPSEYTVAEVNDYLDQAQEDGNLDEVRRVLDAERTGNGGKGRAGILNRTVPDSA